MSKRYFVSYTCKADCKCYGEDEFDTLDEVEMFLRKNILAASEYDTYILDRYTACEIDLNEENT